MPDDTRFAAPPPTLAASTPALSEDLPRTPFAFLWRYIRAGFAGPIALMNALLSLGTLADTVQAFVLGQLVNTLAGVSHGNPALWFAALCGTWLGGHVLANGYNLVFHRAQIGLRVRIHEDLFAYLLDHAPRYFLDHTSGTLAHKIRTAAAAGIVIIDYVSVHAVRFVILFGVTGAMLWRTAPSLLPQGALFLLVVIALAGLMAQRLRPLAKASSNAASDQAGRMGDAAANWDSVRSFTAASFESATLKPFNDNEAATFVRLRVAAVAMRVVLHTLSFVFLAWLAWHALAAARAGTITVGVFTMLLSLYMLVGANIRQFGDAMFTYFENLGLMTDALNTILAPHEIVDPPGAVPLRVVGAIEVRTVDFAYADGTTVFRNFSLSISAGEKVGVVGASGAGKSTLIKLIRRQFPLSAGQILIDGQDVAHVTWDSVHDAFAEVPQNPGMFHRSVRENIAYGRPGAREDEIVAAAKLAHCHEFIASRAQGYDSIVGEKGMKLSGGERQRVAIARAFLKNAPILLLDEATSSLDSEAEHLIQDALLSLMKGRTVIAIAHRLSTIMHMDRIVVLENGRIVEQGPHAALLAKGGAYARLWQHQAGGFM